ncbi:MAG: sulfotransferase, partial [Symploca sp. SIO1A3]|nr:sulfotransferase [Symploca sp. SIO1A3]
MPNFLVIGAAKSGTTTLHNYLNQHPQIYMSSLKEPHFFSGDAFPNRPITNLEDYCALFQGVSDEIAIGESSTTYLGIAEIAAECIQHYIPKAKLIAILRDPAEATYSLYLMSHRSKLHGVDEKKILKNFAQVIQNKSSQLIRRRYYYNNLKYYFSRFEREQIKICLY